MSSEKLTNNGTSTTTGAIDGATDPVTFTVASASSFPTSGNFRVVIDSEILKVTSVAGANFTASRAQEGSTIASHLSGATVAHVVTAASLPLLTSLTDTFANRPAAGVAGRMFLPSDGGFAFRDNGSSWDMWPFGLGPMNPNTADFTTWVNQSSYSIASNRGYNVISWTGTEFGSGENLGQRMKSLPGGNWTMTLVVLHNKAPGGSGNFGIVMRNSSNSRIIGHGIRPSNNTYNGWQWSDSTTFNTNIFNDNVVGIGGPLHMIRVSYDGTNYKFSQSCDFVNWHENRSVVAASSYIPAPDQIGYYLNVNTLRSNQTESISVLHAALE